MEDVDVASKHSFIAFYPSDWIGGTARLPRLHRSVFFEVCCYIWDAAKPVPAREIKLMLADLSNGAEIIDDLIETGKLERLSDGSITNTRALHEAEKAYGAWERMSQGGRNARSMGDGKGDAKHHANGHDRQAALPMPENQNQNQSIAPNGACASGDALKPEHVVDEWNKVAERIARPKVRDLTPARRQLVKARIAQYGLDDFVSVFDKIEQSPFLRGDKRWAGATFDWSMKAANFQKVIEGNYDV